jgi:two-component system chemotaxis response regulator CheY
VSRKNESNGKTVLIVDDNSWIRRMMESAFLSAGFKTCRQAQNGKAAINSAKRIKPDLITLDLSMPVMDGLKAAPQLRKFLPTTPIILFTLFGEELNRGDLTNAGINLVLSKTVALTTLVQEAQRLLAG